MSSVANAVETLRLATTREPISRLAKAFAAAGFELALVGGPVRDAFLERPVNDFDFTTSAMPDEIEKIVKPLASATWDVGRDFGTIAAQLGDFRVEITTYRADSYDGTSRKPEVIFGDSLEADLFRRDFTMNAMALTLPELKLVDPCGGLADLLAGVLKTPIAPEESFNDDPLRMMRAARFASQIGASIEASTLQAMTDMAGRIEDVSAERVRDELLRMLASDNPRLGLEILVETGLAERVLPELPALKLETDEHAHHKDVYQHTLTVLDQAIAEEKLRNPRAQADVTLRLAALLHDIGKPATRRFEAGGTVTFYHHDVVGAKLATKRLKALRLDKETITAVATLIELHLRFFGYADAAWSDSAVRRYVRDAGAQLDRLHIVVRADVTTRNKRKADRLSFAYDDLENRIAELAEQEQLQAMRPDLDGEEIMKILGIGPGRDVGQAYRFLLEVRLDEGEIGAEAATQRLLEWWAAR
ncbi:MAG: RNA nucleotidyltransferase [Microbacteriaceae bacterium BACL25 MAG-120322-bin65]|jgi:poly(A) polymerase|nr:MAG: RNA nucleotidyltransferase [Microbacteriaceae bacterium BACL25 MAG-120322-bin65]